ncbi:hypothetical protein C8Q75DRAFT_805264 [Abortiporus biennis]|nr:hypothetical protein C8Q75DRAFT_805264 [Abortiporus biennis]
MSSTRESPPLYASSITTKPKVAPAPWDISAKADAILRTRDHVDFYVRKAVLSVASDVFEGMFSLPELPDNRKRKEPDNGEYIDGIPIVELQEDSSTITTLLQYCYPMPKPKHFDPRKLCNSLYAARKYMMEYAESELITRFESQVGATPYQFYLLASKFGWQREAKIAAEVSLLHEFKPEFMPPLLEEVSALVLSRLLKYRESCVDAALNEVGHERKTIWFPPNLLSVEYKFPWLKYASLRDWVFFKCQNMRTPIAIVVAQMPSRSDSTTVLVPYWWVLYMEEVKKDVQAYPRKFTKVYKPEYLEKYTAAGASNCAGTCCADRLPNDLVLFHESLIRRVDQALKKVPFMSSETSTGKA